MIKSSAFELGFEHGVKQAFTAGLGKGLVEGLDSLGGLGQSLVKTVGGDRYAKFDKAQDFARKMINTRIVGPDKAQRVAKALERLDQIRAEKLQAIHDTVGTAALGLGGSAVIGTAVNEVGYGPGRRPEESGEAARRRLGY